jgi:hypothetical protein
VLGALGQREAEDGKSRTQLDERERPIVSRQALGIGLKSVLAAVVATGIAWLI